MVVADVDETAESTVVTIAIGLFVGVLLGALLLAGWYATRPAEPGLRWGDTVYTSEEQFENYLRVKGLSYSTWIDRHPGAAPWGSP